MPTSRKQNSEDDVKNIIVFTTMWRLEPGGDSGDVPAKKEVSLVLEVYARNDKASGWGEERKAPGVMQLFYLHLPLDLALV